MSMCSDPKCWCTEGANVDGWQDIPISDAVRAAGLGVLCFDYPRPGVASGEWYSQVGGAREYRLRFVREKGAFEAQIKILKSWYPCTPGQAQSHIAPARIVLGDALETWNENTGSGSNKGNKIRVRLNTFDQLVCERFV